MTSADVDAALAEEAGDVGRAVPLEREGDGGATLRCACRVGDAVDLRPGHRADALDELPGQPRLVAAHGTHRCEQARPAESVTLSGQARRTTLGNADLLEIADGAAKAGQ